MVELVGNVKEWKLFRDAMHKLGRLFYRENKEGKIIEVVYCSNEKGLRYTGEITQEIAALIRAEGWKVDTLEFDEDRGIIKIEQK